MGLKKNMARRTTSASTCKNLAPINKLVPLKIKQY